MEKTIIKPLGEEMMDRVSERALFEMVVKRGRILENLRDCACQTNEDRCLVCHRAIIAEVGEKSND